MVNWKNLLMGAAIVGATHGATAQDGKNKPDDNSKAKTEHVDPEMKAYQDKLMQDFNSIVNDLEKDNPGFGEWLKNNPSESKGLLEKFEQSRNEKEKITKPGVQIQKSVEKSGDKVVTREHSVTKDANLTSQQKGDRDLVFEALSFQARAEGTYGVGTFYQSKANSAIRAIQENPEQRLDILKKAMNGVEIKKGPNDDKDHFYYKDNKGESYWSKGVVENNPFKEKDEKVSANQKGKTFDYASHHLASKKNSRD